MDEMILKLTNLVYGIIVASTPVDTRNLLNNTTYKFDGQSATITISAPKITKKGATNYAGYVNYNRQRGAKEIKNYHYVEKAIIQAVNIFAEQNEGVVLNEL